MSAVPNVSSRKGFGGRPKKWSSVKELEKIAAEYFEELEKSEVVQENSKTGIKTYRRKPAYFGSFLLKIGADYKTIAPYEAGQYDTGDNSFSAFFARVRLLCEEDLFTGSAQGVYQDRITQAALTHMHGWAQKVELTGANGGPVEFKGVLDEWSR
jgi:hypothetical protein